MMGRVLRVVMGQRRRLRLVLVLMLSSGVAVQKRSDISARTLEGDVGITAFHHHRTRASAKAMCSAVRLFKTASRSTREELGGRAEGRARLRSAEGSEVRQ